jgi:hypothetical protein
MEAMKTYRLVLAAFFVAIWQHAGAAPRAALIDHPSQAKSSATPGAKRDRGEVRSRVATPNLPALHELRDALRAQPGVPQEIELPAFEDRTVVLTIDRIEELHGTTNYYGTVGGDPLSSAVITESKGTVAIHASVGGRAWKVTLRGNHYEAAEIDQSAFPGADEPALPSLPQADLFAQPKADVTASADDGSTVDVMVVYTSTARAGAGGVAAIENQIALAIASANQAYASTGVVQRLRLVHSVEAAYPESSPTDMEVALDAITNGASPFGNVASLRTQYGADLVSLWIENGGNWCGLGWVLSTNSTAYSRYGFSVVDRGCATDNSSFAHELGHNMGLTHDLYQINKVGDTTTPVQPYGHGYVSVPARFRTVMAYDSQCYDSGVYCARLNSFSTPLYTYNGAAIGNASTADSTRVLNLTRTTVANFKAATVNIPATLAIAAATYTVAEGATATLTVNRTGNTTGTSTVAWATANGTAVAGQDFNAASGTLTFNAGETAKTISIPILDDTMVESNEAFTVTLSSPSNAVLGTQASSTVTITSNDSALGFAASSATVAENTGYVTLRVTRTGSLAAPANVNFTTSNGTAIAGTDFGTAGSIAQVTGTLAFAANQAYRDIYVGSTIATTPYIRVINDAVSEGPKTFNVTLSSPTGGAVLGTGTQAVVTINSEDVTVTPGPNTLAFASATAVATEGSPSITLSVRRSGTMTGTASVSWSAANGSAVAGTHFGVAGNTTAPSGTLSWAANETAAKNIVIPLLNDTIAESAKTFTVALSGPAGTGVSIGTISAVTVTLNDNDGGVALASSAYSVNEAGGSVTLQVRRSGATSGAASVRWTTANGTAAAGQDFGDTRTATQLSGVLSWLAGDASVKNIVIPVINDTMAEGAEAYTETLNTPSGVAIVSPSSATVTIVDNDAPPATELRFSQPKYVVLENGGNVTLTVNRIDVGGGFGASATATFSTVAGTALATSDFTTRTGTLTWAAGDSSPKTIVIPIVDNAIAEPTEAFKVTLSGASGTGVGTPEASVVILDDDEAFPAEGAIPEGWVMPTGADGTWHVSSDPGPYEGALSLKTDSIDDGQGAEIQVAGVGPGTVSFRVKVSSEAGFDVLRFYVDGVAVASWSGTTVAGRQAFTYAMPAGSHTLKWAYEKDGSVSMGQDAAWIDAVVLP